VNLSGLLASAAQYPKMCLMKRKIFTKKAMVWRSFRLPAKSVDLWRAAAAKEEISQSEFLRKAIRETARRVLLAEEVGKDGPR
jgi:hypothetical protein